MCTDLFWMVHILFGFEYGARLTCLGLVCIRLGRRVLVMGAVSNGSVSVYSKGFISHLHI